MNKKCRMILDVLDSNDRILSAKEIHFLLKETNTNKAPGLTTIYRLLDILEKDQKVYMTTLLDGEKRYSRANSDECFHQIVCKSCLSAKKLPKCIIHEYYKYIAEETEYAIQTHVLEFFGLCRYCKQTAQQDN